MISRYYYIIKGQVQGVGFRPFIYKIANQFNLIGFVKNTVESVELEVEGEINNLNQFDNYLKNNLPVLARIDHITKKKIKPLYKGQFEIIQSSFQSSFVSLKTISVPPDVSICDECKLDIKQIENYIEYFSTNCTNCGARYSIIQTVPYDRENTSMKKFPLCDSCKEEYQNPSNKRFHAQAISCKNCGPKLTLHYNNTTLENNIYKTVSLLISDGKIGAVKGIGGFHIVCDATNIKTIQNLRKLKNRPSKPFAIMCKDINMIKSIANITKKEEELLLSKEAPIVLLDKLTNAIDTSISNFKIGCMLPYTGFYHILFKYLNNPIIATSANIGGEPIITTKDNIEQKLPWIDFIVDYNRDIINFTDDSVTQVVDNNIQILRLSRGYAPKEIQLPFKVSKNILALGANQKNTITLAFDNKLILSPYIGDLNNLQSIEALKNTIKTFSGFYDFTPDIIVCDKHKEYESTKLAQTLANSYSSKLIYLQHHLSHLYSVKAEYNLTGNYTAFIFDGTGLGDDNTLWGGEIFVNDTRKYYFKPIKLLGGEKAIKECRRVALSLLFEHYSLEETLTLNLPTIKSFTKSEIKLLYRMWKDNLNSPKSSSIGRLFDAIASISNTTQNQTYEGEAGILSEAKIKDIQLDINNRFQYTILDNIISINFNFFDIQIIEKFYATIVKIIIDISLKENLPIILSGGVFQNKTLLEFIIKECKINNIKYFYNQQIPINDSGISIGQAYYASTI